MRPSLSRPSLSVVLASLALTAGCSAAHETSASTEDDLRLHPTGTETMSNITIQLPTGSCLPGNSCSKPLSRSPTFALDGIFLSLGAPARVQPGSHTLTVNGTTTTIDLVAGASRTITVPVAEQICQNDAASGVPETQFGRVPTLRNAACPAAVSVDGRSLAPQSLGTVYFNNSGCGGNWTPVYIDATTNCSSIAAAPTSGVWINGTCNVFTQTDQSTACQELQSGNCSSLGAACMNGSPWAFGGYQAVVPGAYTFQTETQGAEIHALVEGDLTELTFNLPVVGTVPAVFTTNLTFADERALQDAAVTTITSSCERNWSVPQGQATGVVVALTAFQFPECTYTLNVPGRSQALVQTSDNNITLHRLDIDDVTVTREDGTTFTTQGTYQVFYGGSVIAGPYPTATGIDVLGGDYEIAVSYTTATGAKVDHYTASF